MADRRDHRNFRRKNGPRHALIVERPEILHRSAAAPCNEHICYLVRVGIADRARDLRRGLRALYAHRQNFDLRQRIALVQDPQHIHDRRARAGRDNADHVRIRRQRFFQAPVKQPLGQQLRLQLLKCHVQVARACGRQVLTVELIRPIARKYRDPPHGQHLHPVLRFEAQPPRTRAEHHAPQRALGVLHCKIVMPRGIYLIVAELSLNAHLPQQRVPVKQPLDVGVDL